MQNLSFHREVTTDLTEELAPMGFADLGIPSPRVELLPFKGPKDMVLFRWLLFFGQGIS